MAFSLAKVFGSWWSPLRRPRLPELVLAAAALLALIAPTWWSGYPDDEQRRAEVALVLRTAVDESRRVVREWSEGIRLRASLAVESPALRKEALARIRDFDRGHDLSAESLEELQATVKSSAPIADGPDVPIGFRVLDSRGIVVASDSSFVAQAFDEIPAEKLVAALRAQTIVSAAKETPDSGESGRWPIWILAPLRSQAEGHPIAGVIALEYDAAAAVRLAVESADGAHWKTIAIARSGSTIGPVRDNASQTSVECDGETLLFQADQSPVTIAAGSAGAIWAGEQIRLYLDGVEDGHGVKSVAAWGTVSDIGLGMLTTLPYDEAFDQSIQFSRVLPILLLLLGLSMFFEASRTGTAERLSNGESRETVRASTRSGLAWGILAASLVVTGVLYLTIRDQVEESNRQQLEHEAGHIQSRLVERARLYTYAFEILGSSLSTRRNLNQSEFNQLAEPLLTSSITPGVERVDYIRAEHSSLGRVSQGSGEAFLTYAPSGWPLVPEVIDAANAARAGRATVFGEPLSLNAGGARGQKLLVVSPAYDRSTVSPDINEATELHGWFVAVVAPDAFFKGLGPADFNLEFALFEDTADFSPWGSLSGTDLRQ